MYNFRDLEKQTRYRIRAVQKNNLNTLQYLYAKSFLEITENLFMTLAYVGL